MEIYIHIPFCKSKCKYCDFNSYANCSDDLVKKYINSLCKEIKYASILYKNKDINTIYIGGGTPSYIDEIYIEQIVITLKKYFNIRNIKEFTIECNPESITESKLKKYKSLGVNRLSIGVQSLNDNNLNLIGRVHDSKTAIDKIKLASNYFNNLSCDFIIGLPYDTVESIKEEVTIVAPYLKHISTYELILEEHTPLYNMVHNGNIVLPNDDETQELFDNLIDHLNILGFNRYEISNFSKDNYDSIHNLGYWYREEYIGFGAGASSYIKLNDKYEGIRYKSKENIEEYIKSIQVVLDYSNISRSEVQYVSDDDAKKETIFLGLRTRYGINNDLITIPDNLKKFFNFNKNKVFLNNSGMAVMNSILCEIL